MSWFSGIIGTCNLNLDSYIKDRNPLFIFRSDRLSVFAGGIKENIFYRKTGDFSGWVVSGIGIQKHLENYRFTSFNAWELYVSGLDDQKNSQEMNGHYAGIKWSDKEILFFNDLLGVREIYFLEFKSFTAFSTNPDFFIYLGHRFEIDLKELSGYWLLTFPLTTKSIFKYILRMGPGGRWALTQNKWTKKNEELNFQFNGELRRNSFIENVEKMTTFPLSEGKKLSLGLTGGMDSRVLLELLLRKNRSSWQAHFFGPKDLPDVITAGQICLENKISYKYLGEQSLKCDESLKLLMYYVRQLGLTGMSSAILFYPFYSSLYDQKVIIIDGGHGEIHRRESLNKILVFAGNALLKKDGLKIYERFYRKRADIFNTDVLKLLEKEAINQISGLFDKMPDPKITGIGTWLDILMIKYSLPNLTGPSQTLLDSMAVAYMPYIQIDLLKESLHLPLKEKRNGKIFNRIINESANKLNNYRLVKNSIYYPYWATSFFKRFLMIYKKKFGIVYNDTFGEQFLYTMREYINDIVNSAGFNSFEYYDHSGIKDMVKKFYDGDKSYTSRLNWWLTFDVWRSVFLNK